ncbi:HSP70 [Carnation yellow fleck virus]|uniref:HSP70 n=1 Tax=Carnation yellow fleck virus TaxID=940280 RepID=UPI0003C9D6E4|nr:HSP70 [Carnation yellow fleck virus]ADV40940.1 HSP70 [Carnation yellow fleck virus]
MVVFGLDFGTTFSSVCAYVGNELYLYKQRDSAYIPTYLYLHADSQEVAFGYDAEVLSNDPSVRGGFYRDLKRWVGCDEENYEEYLTKLSPPYKTQLVKVSTSSKFTVKLDCYSGTVPQNATLPGLIATYVRALIMTASEAFKCQCTGVICSVPANYNCLQRSFTENCINLSGFTCVYMINEPSAAALSACSKIKGATLPVLVYDFGGGTFDVSVLSALNNTFVVRASGGDMNLGGRDVDRAFLEYLYNKAHLPVNYKLDISFLKESLSRKISYLNFPVVSEQGAKVDVLVNVSELAKVAAPFIERTVRIVREVYEKYLSSMRLSNEVKAKLLMVGGSSYLPGLKSLLSSTSFIDECIILSDARAAVAGGCALYSACLRNDSPMLLVDCAAHDLSISSKNCESIVCVPAGSPIPFTGTRTVNMSGSNAKAVYSAALFEGDYVKCRLNKRIFSGDVTLGDVGVTGTASRTIPLTLEINVSSVGTISFNIVGPTGTKKSVGGDAAYNFSNYPLGTRAVADLHKHNSDKVKLIHCLTYEPFQRKKINDSEKDRFLKKVSADYQREAKSFCSYDDKVFESSGLLLGRVIPKIFRGSRVEKLTV